MTPADVTGSGVPGRVVDDRILCNGGRPTPIRLVTYEPVGGTAVTPAGTRAPS